jgi:hypothetical protein
MRPQWMQSSIFKIHVVFCFLDLSATLIFFFFEISTPRDIKDLFFVYI